MSREHRYSRRRLLGATGASTAAALAGCLGGSGNDDGIHFYTDYSTETWQNRWEDDLIPAFEDETDHTVNPEYAGFQGDSEERLMNLIQANDPPDIHVETFYTAADIWAQGMLQPMTDTLEAVEDVNGDINVETFEDEEGVVSQGDTFHVSHGGYTNVLVYREDIYDALGLDVPETWDELVDNAETIDDSDEFDTARGFATPAGVVGQSRELFWMFLYQNGVDTHRTADGDVEVWVPEDEAIEALDYLTELAQYSPDPSGLNWGTSLEQWVQGRVGQMYHVNGWAAGVAAAEGIDHIAENTAVAPLPRNDIPLEESYMTLPTGNGYMVFEGGNNPAGAVEFIEWLYADSIERTASLFEQEPMRLLPAYDDVVASDAYANLEYFQAWPEHLELNRQIQEEIVPMYGQNTEESPTTGAEQYGLSGYHYADMMNQIIVGDAAIEDALATAKGQAEERLAEGKELTGGW
ncbi:ABC transporter substrate-binding protein [Natrialba asiatica]|uniref:Extracellular solute-binding protein n=1 Tax=Natrialba asiatica (strain ATCC 700177 / DSM 12278 / JCM 9576 / FERM P-10747 / NBRC 102637 / 172P1) TaxID=29540 RepID=M0ALS2_NATA1|nr:extracellular solute-binding protein [Natrialba asiatica]ELY99296.1 extracellular solute-binding protein [Natrialba asiatica DSM 12278]